MKLQIRRCLAVAVLPVAAAAVRPDSEALAMKARDANPAPGWVRLPDAAGVRPFARTPHGYGRVTPNRGPRGRWRDALISAPRAADRALLVARIRPARVAAVVVRLRVDDAGAAATPEAVMSVDGRGGRSYRVGVVATSRGPRWSGWEMRAGRAIAVTVSDAPVTVGRWQTLALRAGWLRPRGLRRLEVDGQLALRVREAGLRSVTARRVRVGLFAASGRRSLDRLSIRYASVRSVPAGRPQRSPATAPEPVPVQRLAPEDQPYSPGFAFNQPIPAGTAADSRSAAIVARLDENTARAKVSLASRSDVPPVYVASPEDPLLPIRAGGLSTEFRIPDGVEAGGGSDRPLVILDPAHPEHGPTELRLYKAEVASGTVEAAGGGLVKYTEGDAVPFEGNGTGSGLSVLAGLIRPEEVRAGHIRHALRFAYSAPDFSDDYRAPAVRTDQPNRTSTRDPASAMDMGMRLQLDPAVDCNTRTVPGEPADSGPTRLLRMVCRALQEYGMIAVDGTGDGALILMMENTATADWASLLGPERSDSYSYVIRDRDTPDPPAGLDETSGIPWHRLRVLERSEF